MKFSPKVHDLDGKSAAVWDLHTKASDAKDAGEDVILLSIGDPEFSTPEHIIKSATQAMLNGDTHYTDSTGRMTLREAVINDFHKMGGPSSMNTENVMISGGAQNALYTSAFCLLSPGDDVLVFDPMYVTYEALLKATGANIIRIPASHNNAFRPNTVAMEDAITPNTKAIFFANPNNPSGTVLSIDELQIIADFACKHDLWVVADEVYNGLIYEKKHVPIASLANMTERTVTIGSVSKSYAMTGWRCGWMIAPEELIYHASNLSLCMIYGLPGFIQEAAATALLEGGKDKDKFLELYKKRCTVVEEGLLPIKGIKTLKPEAGMFMLIDIRGTGYSSYDFCNALYEETGVSLLDASAFGDCLEGFVRLSFAIEEAGLKEATHRMRNFVENIKKA